MKKVESSLLIILQVNCTEVTHMNMLNIADSIKKANTKKVYKRKKLTFFCERVVFERKNLLKKVELSF